MSITLRKAARTKAKLRVGLSGPAGSGKTYSGLLLAYGLVGDWEKIAVIDTENGSGELYSDLGPYNVITLEAPHSPERYIEALRAAEVAGMQAIIVDSVSHEWEGKGGCLEINELLAGTKFKGNTWAAWSETTPRHRKFIEALISSPAHIITTARSKTDMMQTEDKKVKKVGLKEIQREGYEYELTVNFTLDREGHYAIASKDRTKLFIDRDPFLITEDTGRELKKWNDGGTEAKVNVPVEKAKIMHNLKRLGMPVPADKQEAGAVIQQMVHVLTDMDLSVDANLPLIVRALEMRSDAEDAQFAWHKAQQDAEKQRQESVQDFDQRPTGPTEQAAEGTTTNTTAPAKPEGQAETV